MQQSIVKFYCFVVQTLLNMFRALLCPSSGAHQTAVAASGFRIECGGGRVLSRGRFVSVKFVKKNLFEPYVGLHRHSRSSSLRDKASRNHPVSPAAAVVPT